MDRARAIRLLRIATSAVCGAACVLVVVLWMWSFDRAVVQWAPVPGYGSLVIASAPGYMEASLARESQKAHASWGLATHSAEPNRIRRILNLNFGAFGLRRTWDWKNISLTAPHWFVVLLTATCTVLPLIKWQWRFTLRTMFAKVAIVAFVLWMIMEIRG